MELEKLYKDEEKDKKDQENESKNGDYPQYSDGSSIY